MLKLELVRFSFSAVNTYGVMHSREGWSCFTREGVVLNTATPPPGKAALGEGLYRVRVIEPKPNTWALGVYDIDDAPAVAKIVRGYATAFVYDDIHVGRGMDMETSVQMSTGEAILGLLRLVKRADETYLNIRHLDNTQLLHFERMAREAIQ